MDISQWVISLLVLTGLEIILGIDNIIFLTILAGRLPPKQQPMARRMGLLAALLTRLGLLFAVNLLMSLTEPLVEIPEIPKILHKTLQLSLKDLILVAGGLFLVAKSVMEIHHKLEGEEDEISGPKRTFASFWMVVGQIAVIDIIFSLDSVITAVGMARDLSIIITAMVITIGIMVIASEPVAGLVEKHPTLKILGLSFLILIGFLLVLEGFHQEVQKGYIYFTMAFALGVEAINIRIRPGKALNLNEPDMPQIDAEGAVIEKTPVDSTNKSDAPSTILETLDAPK